MSLEKFKNSLRGFILISLFVSGNTHIFVWLLNVFIMQTASIEPYVQETWMCLKNRKLWDICQCICIQDLSNVLCEQMVPIIIIDKSLVELSHANYQCFLGA